MDYLGRIPNSIPVYISKARCGEMVKRTIRERLFSLPWRPFDKWVLDTNKGEYMIKTGVVVKTPEGITMNPDTFARMTGTIN